MVKLLVVAVCDVASGVLALAGLIKLFDPTPWAQVVTSLGFPLRRRGRRVLLVTARVVGALEIVVAVGVVVVGGGVSYGALALCYLSFGAVSAVAWRRGGVSCGCFGARSAPLSGMHVVANAAVAAVALAATALNSDSLVSRLDGGVGASIAYLLFAALGSATVVALLTTAADLLTVTGAVTLRSTPRRTGTRPHGAHR